MTSHETLKASAEEEGLDYYFDSYSHFGIHEEMLKDTVRTKTYRDAILKNREMFQGKIVLDVGCGTGILSMFAAQAGAEHVFGVDMASIANQAQQIVKANGFEDQITIIRGKIEEIDLPLPAGRQVDIIISEWMGYYLLYESMLDSVLYARDKWMGPNGLVFPDAAKMYICGIEDEEYKDEKIQFWDDVYGFDMSCIKEFAMNEPLVDTVPPEAIITTSDPILSIDLSTITKEELDFASNFSIEFRRPETMHAFVVYFDVTFNGPSETLTLTTTPMAKSTHWKQTIMYLDTDMQGQYGDNISGSISTKRNARNPRELDIQLSSKQTRSNHVILQQSRSYHLC